MSAIQDFEIAAVHPDSSAEPQNDSTRPLPSAQQAEQRYLAVISPLLADAWQDDSMEALADVLAWTIARIVVGMEKQFVTGDILRRVGNYTCNLVEANRAKAEADEAIRAGHTPH